MGRILLDRQQQFEEREEKDFLERAAGVGEKVLGFTGGQRYAEVGGGLLAGQSLGDAIRGAGGAGRVAGDIAKLGTFVGSLATPALPTKVGRVLFGGGVGAALSGASATERGETLPQIAGKTAIGFGLGSVVSGVFEGAAVIGRKIATKAVPKLLSYTSDTPQLVIQKQVDDPTAAATALRGVKGQPITQPLDITQDAIKSLRKRLSQDWDDGMEHIIQRFRGKRIGLNVNEEGLMQTVSQEYKGILEVPQSVKSMGARETMKLYNSVNRLFEKKAVRESAQGINVRSFKNVLKDKMIGGFGGAQGDVSKLLSNYGAKANILNAADDLARAYKDTPTAQASALTKLQSVFREDKAAYLSAIQDLERASGKSIVDVLSAQKLKPILPTKEGKFTFEDIFRLVLTPITSPRLAGIYARTIGRLLQQAESGVARNVLRTSVLQAIANLLGESQRLETQRQSPLPHR